MPPKRKRTETKEGKDDGDQPKPKRVWKGPHTMPDPPRWGEKPKPQGKDDCLMNLTFVLTGVLDSMTRDEAKSLIEKYGGRVTTSISGKTSFVVKGDLEPGESKLKKAAQLGTRMLSEDKLFELIQTTPTQAKSATTSKPTKSKPIPNPAKPTPNPANSEPAPKDNANCPLSPRSVVSKQVLKSPNPSKPNESKEQKSVDEDGILLPPPPPWARATKIEGKEEESKKRVECVHDELWTDRYAPTTLDDVIGNGPLLKPLLKWLQNWPDKVPPKVESKHRCHLLIGPPGTGKSTAAHLLARTAGFSIVELNASDVRNAKSVDEAIREAIHGKRVIDIFHTPLPTSTNDQSKLGDRPNPRNKRKDAGSLSMPRVSKTSKVRVLLVMDEVDGMSGNEDRGGIRRLLQAIRVTQIPILAIANDGWSPKIKTLKHSVTSHTWKVPLMDMVLPRLKMICDRESVVLSAPVIERVWQLARGDIRHTLMTLQMLTVGHIKQHTRPDNDSNTNLGAGRDGLSVEKVSVWATKSCDLGPFEAALRFLAIPYSDTWISDRMDLYFADTQMIPLLVAENYLRTTPNLDHQELWTSASKRAAHGRSVLSKEETERLDTMDRLADASDSISIGDLVSTSMYKQMTFELMPLHAFFSCLLPGRCMSGNRVPRMEFPSWLGHYSRQAKHARELMDLAHKCRINQRVVERSDRLALHFLPVLRRHLIDPLVNPDPSKALLTKDHKDLKDHKDQDQDQKGPKSNLVSVLQIMKEYHLSREDWATVAELTERFTQEPKFAQVEAKSKAALTREYNKQNLTSVAARQSLNAIPRGKRNPLGRQRPGILVAEDQPDNDEDDLFDEILDLE